MRFEDIKVGMVFDNEQPPHFLYIHYKDDRVTDMYSINVKMPLDSENSGKIHFMDWEDQFEFMERVDGYSSQRYEVFKELFG